MKRIIALVLVGIMILSLATSVFAGEYIVNEGDMLWKIAKDNNTTVQALVELNNIKDVNLIKVNQVIKLTDEKKESEMATMTNSEKAVALIESIGTSNTQPASYINAADYTQHNLGVADGIAGFGAVLAQLPEGSYGKNIRVIEDGDFVIMHNEYNFFGPKVGFDVFRFENGLIVEHWDNLAVTADDVNVSGRGQLDGTTVLKDLEQTESNKKIVTNLMNDVFLGAAPEKITDYFSVDKYFQHNTGVADGLDGLGAALQALAEAGMPMTYTKVYNVFGQGNFVVTVSEGLFLNEHVAFYDMFRLEDGKVVEHWDVIETIPAEADWMHRNGKF